MKVELDARDWRGGVSYDDEVSVMASRQVAGGLSGRGRLATWLVLMA